MAEKIKPRASFSLGIHGSRTLKDERVKIILMEEIKKHKPTVIVTHAEPGGVCEMARELSREMAIPLKMHYLNFKYLRGAFEHRSIDIIRDSDHSVFIHDGTSKGTSNELKLAKKMNAATTLHLLDPAEHEKSVGFMPDEDWGAGLRDGRDLL
jgi:hypothetical protein